MAPPRRPGTASAPVEDTSTGVARLLLPSSPTPAGPREAGDVHLPNTHKPVVHLREGGAHAPGRRRQLAGQEPSTGSSISFLALSSAVRAVVR